MTEKTQEQLLYYTLRAEELITKRDSLLDSLRDILCLIADNNVMLNTIENIAYEENKAEENS